VVLTPEKTTHLLSVIRATTKGDGVGEATPSGLRWKAGTGGVSVAVRNEGGGSRVQVSVGRWFSLSLAGTLGVIGGSVMAGLLEPITLGVFLGSVAGGLGVAVGAGVAFSRSAKVSVARVMNTVSRTMTEMGEWEGGYGGALEDPGPEDPPGRNSTEVARNVERLEALEDSRRTMGLPVTVRRLTVATVMGASLASLLPTALRFYPTEYPLPWIIVGGLGWALARTLSRLFRGIRERKRLDGEIEALIESMEGDGP
jgi:hypothetical protein